MSTAETQTSSNEPDAKSSDVSPGKQTVLALVVGGNGFPEEALITDRTAGILRVANEDGTRVKSISLSVGGGSAVEYAKVVHDGEEKMAWVLRPHYRELGWKIMGF